MHRARDTMRRAAAEGVGTGLLVFAGCGAIVVDAQTGALGHLGVSLVFGLVVGCMVAATGHLSGAHLNPAVTLAFWSSGSLPGRLVLPYVTAQAGGAIAGAAAVAALVGTEASAGATTPSVPVATAIGLEVVLTFVLMFVIAAVATDARARGHHAAVAIGGAVALGALVGGPLTGASMNPARSLGPALVAGTWSSVWIYVVGPVAGAVAAAWTYRGVGAAPGPRVQVVGAPPEP